MIRDLNSKIFRKLKFVITCLNYKCLEEQVLKEIEEIEKHIEIKHVFLDGGDEYEKAAELSTVSPVDGKRDESIKSRTKEGQLG